MATDSRVQHFIYNDVTSSDDFRIWLITFESYCKAADPDISKQDMAYSLLACIGDHGHRTLLAVNAEYDKMDYDTMVNTLKKKYIKTDKKQILVLFNNMRLGDSDKSERLSDYVERIKRIGQLINRASDNAVIEKLLSDPNIANLDDGKIFEKLMTSEITVDNLLEWQTARESCNKLRNDIATRDTCLNLLQVPYDRSRRNSSSSQGSNNSQRSTTSYNKYRNNNNYYNKPSTNKRWCRNCGRKEFPHSTQCPATNQKCRNPKCNKIGHFERCCPLLPKVNKVDNDEQFSQISDDEVPKKLQMITVNINSVKTRPCPTTTLVIGNNNIKLMLDTGSQVNVLTHDTYNAMFNKPALKQTHLRLMPFNATKPLVSLGEFTVETSWHGISKYVNFVVVETNKYVDNLLCFQTMASFKLDWNTIFNNKTINSTKLMDDTNVNMVDGVNTCNMNSAQLTQFILKKYAHEFRNETGLVPDYEAHIDFIPNANYSKCPPQQIPNRLLKPTKHHIERWLNKQISEPVSYQDEITWISSLNPVEKSNCKGPNEELGPEDVRLTVNLKNVNKYINRNTNCTLLPDSRQIAIDLENSSVFSKLDVRDAFSTIPLDQESSKHFVFSTPFGLFRLKRLVQGLCTSSDIYHQYITDHFRDIELTKSCIDDYLVYGKPDPSKMGKPDADLNAIARHDKALFATLDRIRSLNMTLNPEKCLFRHDEVPFYGNMISKHGIKPFESKMRAFLDTINPTTKAELHSFIGMTSHFHNRLPELCDNSGDLYDLLKKNALFKWSEKHNHAFKQVKNSLFTGYLAHFDETKETELFVDAGPKGISYVLTQIDSHGKKWLIECGSHTFSEVQNRYSQVEKECLAITWSIEHLRLKLLLLPKLTIFTDSKAVVDLLNNEKTKQSKSNRMQTWISNLPAAQYKIKHIEGKKNIADFISRCHNNSKDQNFDLKFKTIYSISEQINVTDIVNAINNDQYLVEIQKFINNNNYKLSKTNPYRTVAHTFYINQDNLICVNNKMVIPEQMENIILTKIHGGHNGIPQCWDVLRKYYFFYKMKHKLIKHVTDCRACQASKRKTSVEPMIIMQKHPEKWHITSIDFSSRTTTNDYVLALTETLSGFPIMKISKNLTSKSAIDILNRIFKEFNFIPKIIRSDNGPAFISKEFKAFIASHNIDHQLTTPYWPNANGMPESRMKIINKSIRCSNVTGESWQQILDKALKIYRASIHPSTGYSPNDVLGLPDNLDLPTLKIQPEQINMKKLLDHDLKMKTKSKSNNDKNKHAKASNIDIGDKVLYRWDSSKSKYLPRYDPKEYHITHKNGTMLTAERNDHKTTRNASFFKKITAIEIQPVVNLTCYMFSDPLAKRRLKRIRDQQNKIQNDPAQHEQQPTSNPTTSKIDTQIQQDKHTNINDTPQQTKHITKPVSNSETDNTSANDSNNSNNTNTESKQRNNSYNSIADKNGIPIIEKQTNIENKKENPSKYTEIEKQATSEDKQENLSDTTIIEAKETTENDTTDSPESEPDKISPNKSKKRYTTQLQRLQEEAAKITASTKNSTHQ